MEDAESSSVGLRFVRRCLLGKQLGRSRALTQQVIYRALLSSPCPDPPKYPPSAFARKEERILFPRNLFGFHSSVVTLSVKPQPRPSIDNGPNAELPWLSAGNEPVSARGRRWAREANGRGGEGAKGRKGERAKGAKGRKGEGAKGRKGERAKGAF
jgi:hypothetical protein